MRRRRTSDDERAEFEAAFKEARPVRPPKPEPKTATAKVSGPKAKRAPSGVDGNTDDRLRRGEMTPDVRIDLHGFTERVAHRTLLNFLRGAQRKGARLALVITGKGGGRIDPHEPFDMEKEARARGVLNIMVPRWLTEPSFAALIADARIAHRRHGGEGALYVYLRKRV
jgi:DNA-nicking Smr family endonuclease